MSRSIALSNYAIFGAVSISHLVLNIAYFPEISRFFRTLTGSGALSGGSACGLRSVHLFAFYLPQQP